ncbi:hypothetical protein [Embleya sp. NPDC001921]
MRLATVPDRTSGRAVILHTCDHHVGLGDLVLGLPRPDIDPQLPATMNQLFDRRIETITDRIRRGESA